MIDRTKCPPWGLAGGGDGATARADIYRNGVCIATLVKDDTSLLAGDEIHFYSPGGGGYGNPLLRPVEKVIDDVRCGYVSRESAAADYGVLLDDAFQPTETEARIGRQLQAHPLKHRF
jgi:N-methylhydantoinase B